MIGRLRLQVLAVLVLVIAVGGPVYLVMRFVPPTVVPCVVAP